MTRFEDETRIEPNGDGQYRAHYANANEWPPAWFDSKRYLVTAHYQQAHFFADVSQIEMEIDEQPNLSGVRATGIDIISTKEAVSDVHPDIERCYGDRLSLLDFSSVTAVHAAQASKGNALAAASEILPGTGVEGVIAKLQAVADQLD